MAFMAQWRLHAQALELSSLESRGEGAVHRLTTVPASSHENPARVAHQSDCSASWAATQASVASLEASCWLAGPSRAVALARTTVPLDFSLRLAIQQTSSCVACVDGGLLLAG